MACLETLKDVARAAPNSLPTPAFQLASLSAQLRGKIMQGLCADTVVKVASLDGSLSLRTKLLQNLSLVLDISHVHQKRKGENACSLVTESFPDPSGARTWVLGFRGPMPYPLGHARGYVICNNDHVTCTSTLLFLGASSRSFSLFLFLRRELGVPKGGIKQSSAVEGGRVVP
eukprot:3356290-Amphidinium_carterae.1